MRCRAQILDFGRIIKWSEVCTYLVSSRAAVKHTIPCVWSNPTRLNVAMMITNVSAAGHSHLSVPCRKLEVRFCTDEHFCLSRQTRTPLHTTPEGRDAHGIIAMESTPFH